MEKIVHTKDLRYCIRFYCEEGTPSVNYQVVQIYSFEGELEAPENIMYHNAEDDTFEKAYKSEPICNGFIKWDGCMEIHDMNIHVCYWGNQIQTIVDTIYEQGQLIMGVEYEYIWIKRK